MQKALSTSMFYFKILKLIFREVMVSTVLALVFSTTIVFGALMPVAIKFFKTWDEKPPRKRKSLADVGVAAITEKPEDKLELDVTNNFNYSFSHPNFFKE
jgi:hypothetical protein